MPSCLFSGLTESLKSFFSASYHYTKENALTPSALDVCCVLPKYKMKTEIGEEEIFQGKKKKGYQQQFYLSYNIHDLLLCIALSQSILQYRCGRTSCGYLSYVTVLRLYKRKDLPNHTLCLCQ